MFKEKGKRYLKAVRPFSFTGPVITINLEAILSIKQNGFQFKQ